MRFGEDYALNEYSFCIRIFVFSCSFCPLDIRVCDFMFMDDNNGNPSQGGEPAMEAEDWRSQLKADSRQIIVNKIMERLKRHLPFSGQEGLAELQKIAVKFEEKVYADAPSQRDYLRKISLKMLAMEAKSQNSMTSSVQSNSAGPSVMQPQVTNQGQLLSKNIQSNISPVGVQFSAGLSFEQVSTPALNMSALLYALPSSAGTDVSVSLSSALPSPQGINMSTSSELFPACGLIQTESSSAIFNPSRFMDNNNGNPSQGGELAMETEDWRSQLKAESRQRIVNKIMETLKRHLPFSGQEGLAELLKIAVKFEEKVYADAPSQRDYLRKISLKMLAMEASSVQSNSAGPSVMQPQVTNQGQLLSKNIQSNISPVGVQFSAGLSSEQVSTRALNMSALLYALPSSAGTDVSASVSSALPSPQGINMSTSSSELLPAYGVNQSESSSAIFNPSRFMDNNNGNPAQGGEPAMEAGDWRSQFQAASRQRIVDKIMDALKRHLPFSGQEGLAELQKITVKFEEKVYADAPSQSDYLRKIFLKIVTMETKSQNTMNSSLPSNSAGSSVMQPQVTNQGQLSSENIESNIPPTGVQFSAGLSSAQAPTPALNMSALLAALPPSPGTDVPASISSALPSPQGISMSSSSSGLFPAYSVNQSGSSSALPPAWSLNVLADHQRRQVVPEQQQQQQQSDNPQQWLYHQQSQQLLQRQPQQQVLSQKTPLASSQQSHVQSASLVVQSVLHPNQQSAIPHLTESMLQQTAMPQLQILPPQHQEQQLTASLDSTAQIGDKNGAEWQEEVYKKIKVMKEMYYPELSEMYQKIAGKLHQHDSLPQQPNSDQLEKLKMFKAMLERLITILQLPKSNISLAVKEKLSAYEKQIVNFINANRPRKPGSSLQPGHPPHMQSMQQSQSQITQLQSHENQMNPELQSMNLQGSVPTMQQNNMTGLQQNSMSSLSGVSTSQQNMMNPLQPSSNMDLVRGDSHQSNSGFFHNRYLQQQEQLRLMFLQSQQRLQEHLMQKNQIFQQKQQQERKMEPELPQVNIINDMNTSVLPSSQSWSNMLQGSIDSLNSSSGMVDKQHQKLEQEEKVFFTHLKQPYQQLQIWTQKPQMLQEKQQQQIQQLQRQAKQQLHHIYFIYLIFLAILLGAYLFRTGY